MIKRKANKLKSLKKWLENKWSTNYQNLKRPRRTNNTLIKKFKKSTKSSKPWKLTKKTSNPIKNRCKAPKRTTFSSSMSKSSKPLTIPSCYTRTWPLPITKLPSTPNTTVNIATINSDCSCNWPKKFFCSISPWQSLTGEVSLSTPVLEVAKRARRSVLCCSMSLMRYHKKK